MHCRTGVPRRAVADVAKQAGLSSGTIHYYFESKDALLHSAFAFNFEDSLARCGWLLDDYKLRTHSETYEVPPPGWATSGFIPRTPDELDLLLLVAAATRKVQRDGIQSASTRYVSPVLAAYVGEK